MDEFLEDTTEAVGFHAYRRKWATERKHLPVAGAGGWPDTRSLEPCYQQADEATLLQVVCERRRLCETIPPGGGNGTAAQPKAVAEP